MHSWLVLFYVMAHKLLLMQNNSGLCALLSDVVFAAGEPQRCRLTEENASGRTNKQKATEKDKDAAVISGEKKQNTYICRKEYHFRNVACMCFSFHCHGCIKSSTKYQHHGRFQAYFNGFISFKIKQIKTLFFSILYCSLSITATATIARECEIVNYFVAPVINSDSRVGKIHLPTKVNH